MNGNDKTPDSPNPPESIQTKHPELYGKLLEVNAALFDSGGLLLFLYLALILGASAAVWLEWYKNIPELKDVNLNSFWTYAIIVVLVVPVWLGHFEWMRRACYQRHRDGILEAARREGVRRYRLLAMIAGDKSVAEVMAALQRDRWDEV